MKTGFRLIGSWYHVAGRVMQCVSPVYMYLLCVACCGSACVCSSTAVIRCMNCVLAVFPCSFVVTTLFAISSVATTPVDMLRSEWLGISILHQLCAGAGSNLHISVRVTVYPSRDH